MPERPNILLLMTDQQRFDTIAAAGFPWMRTPNLDRLVREGCLFAQAYSPNPVCVPARHDLLTGVTEAQHGLADNNFRPARLDGLPTLPRVLSDHGYLTAAVGKMHFLPPRRHHGFLELHLSEEIPEHRADDAYAVWLAAHGYGHVRPLHGVRPLVYHEPQRALVPAELHGDAFIADRTIEVLERHGGRRPFFLHASWVKPHPPWNIPQAWQAHYDGIDLPDPIPGPRPAPYGGEPAWFGDGHAPERLRAARAAYYSSISMIDHAVGRILDHLERAGQLDDTLILFTSDHGELLGDHGLWQKQRPFDSCARIPFIVRWPRRFAPGSRDDRFVDLLDILPTALDAAGVDPAEIRSARPYAPVGSSLLRLDEPGGRDRSVQFSGCGRHRSRWCMVRDVRYKYAHFANGGVEWLFDLRTDPHELHNRADDPTLAAELARLRARATELEAELGPEGAVADGRLAAFEARAGDGHIEGRYPLWANQQYPIFGEGTPDDEALLFADQVLEALADHGPGFISEAAPDPAWLEHFLEQLRRHGVSEATLAEVARRLGFG